MEGAIRRRFVRVNPDRGRSDQASVCFGFLDRQFPRPDLAGEVVVGLDVKEFGSVNVVGRAQDFQCIFRIGFLDDPLYGDAGIDRLAPMR